MPRYQIRTPESLFLEDLVSAMAREVWDSSRDSFDTARATEDLFREYVLHLRHFITPFIEAYDLCGHSCECSDEIEGAPWMDYKDHIYHLVLPKSLNIFANDMALDSLKFLKSLLSPERMQKTFVTIERIFRRAFNDHLYFNPVCRKADVCKGAVPVSPWKS